MRRVLILVVASLFILGCENNVSESSSELNDLNQTGTQSLDRAIEVDLDNNLTKSDTQGETNIKTDKVNYFLGELITVNYENISGDDEDWVAIYPKGSDNSWSNVVDWTWASGIDEGSVTFNTPEVGEYEVRLFFRNSFELEATTSFGIKNSTTVLDNKKITSIETDKETYTPNELITINYENISGDDEDWIGIYPEGSSNEWANVIDWTWTSGIKEGFDTFTIANVGKYEARVFFNNSFNLEANVSFTVQNAIQYPTSTTLSARTVDETVKRPLVDTSSYDSVFKTRLRKVNKSDSAIANYPKMQSWNKDMSLIRIASRLYDAKTLEESNLTSTFNASQAFYGLCSRGSDNFRWSTKDSNKFYVLDNENKFIQGKITNNAIDCSDALDTFSEYELVHMGPHEGNIDQNDKYVLFVAKKESDLKPYVILYDIENEKRVWTKLLDGFTWSGSTYNWDISDLDWISVSPSGKYILLNARDKDNYKEGMYMYDINFENPKKLEYEYNGQNYSEGGHGDIGFDMNGNEVLVQFLAGVGVYSFNLDKPSEKGKKVLNVYGGGHVSCRNYERPGWCYMTTFETGYRQVFAVKLDGTANETVQNFSQFHVNSSFIEVYGAPSPDGNQVIFNTNWGNTNTSSIDTYVADKDTSL